MAKPRKFLGSIPVERIRDSGGRFVSGGAGFYWVGLEAMANNINNHGVRLNRTRKKAMEKLGRAMEQYMQEHAPWDDRTGDARRGLKTTVVHDEANAESTVYAGHSVDYGPLLETMQAGRFAIIEPTITIFAPKVLGELRFVGSSFGEGEE